MVPSAAWISLVVLSLPLAAAGQPYVSAQLGFANAEWPRGSPLNGRLDDRAVGYGVDVGFGFRKHWALELGAYGYDDFDARGTPCGAGLVCTPIVSEFGGNEISIVKAALVPHFNVGSVNVFGTVGYYRATIDTNLPFPDAKSRDRGLLLGAGARWYFEDPWSVSIQGARFDDNLYQLMFGVGWGLRRDDDDIDIDIN